MVTTKGVRVASGNLCEAEAPTEATAETKPETTEENTMNAKTERQIENLKKQTIGVEIEMNHITRERAARLAADHFGTGRYEYTASRNGYSTWSAWDAQGREWKFQKDVSIAGCDAEKCELVTPILKYEDIETLQELVRKLRKAGAISHAGIGAGVHIHIGANGHTPQTLRNLANLMASHERLIADALKIDQGRMNRYCRTVNPQFIEQLNYHATFTKGTIEFRLFQFDKPADGRKNGLHAGQLKSYIQLCLALSEMAKGLRTASPKPQQTENPKFAMRTWLIRLGLVGEEFATARNFLTKNLDGDAAFRFGR